MLIRRSAWTLGGKVMSSALGFAANVLLVRLLSPASVGAYFLSLTVVALAAAVGQLGMATTATRLIADGLARGDLGRARGVVVKGGGLASSCLVCLAAASALGLWSLLARAAFGSSEMSRVALEASLWIFLSGLATFCVAVYRGFHRQTTAAIFDGLAVNALFLAGLVGLRLTHASTTIVSVFAVLVVSGVLVQFTMFIDLGRRVGALRGSGEVRAGELLSIGIALMTVGLIVDVLVGSTTDLWVLAAFRTTTSVAIYGAVVRMMTMFQIPFAAFTLTVGPTMSALVARREWGTLERTLRAGTTMIALPTVALLAAVATGATPILSLLFGSYYDRGKWILALLSVAVAANVLTGPWGLALIMTGRQKLMVGLTALFGIASVSGDAFAAPRYGATGVAVASSTTLCLMHTTGLLVTRRCVGFWTGVHFRYAGRALAGLVGTRWSGRDA